MFLVFSKERILSYFVATISVITLFVIAAVSYTGLPLSIQTSASIEKQIPISSVNTNESSVALTINCSRK
jgi:hypothetical protein